MMHIFYYRFVSTSCKNIHKYIAGCKNKYSLVHVHYVLYLRYITIILSIMEVTIDTNVLKVMKTCYS